MFLRYAVLIIFGFGICNTAVAQNSGLRVEAAWARATPAEATIGVAYLTVINSGSIADRLVAVSSPIAERAEIHVDVMEGTMSEMRSVLAVDVKPGDRVVFGPNGMHIMLIGLRQPLRMGDHIPLTITFEKAGRLDTDAVVQAAGAMSYP